MTLFQIYDSGTPLLSDYTYIEAKSQKDAILKYVKENCKEINLKEIEIKRMEKGYNRHFYAYKCKLHSERAGYYTAIGNKVWFECFKK
jgi:hypothetical protein